MLVNIDAKSLELYTCGYLTKDPTLCDELRRKVDIHTANQQLHHLPSRLIAKIFNFRMIFQGTAYAYYKDPDFAVCGYSLDKWQQIIDDTYAKYPGITATHARWLDSVQRTGLLVVEQTGQTYEYKQYQNKRTGEWEWNFNAIVNYPVQGLGHVMVAIARVSLRKRLIKHRCRSLLCSTVHDSIVLDSPREEIDDVAGLAHEVFDDLPKNFEATFGYEFDLPMAMEAKVGINYKDLVDYNDYKKMPSMFD